MSGIVDARGKLVPWLKNYQKASWVNFARNMTTQIIEDIRTIVYVRIVEPPPSPWGGGHTTIRRYKLTVPSICSNTRPHPFAGGRGDAVLYD